MTSRALRSSSSAAVAVLSLSLAATAQLPDPVCNLRWDADIDFNGVAPNGALGRAVSGDFQRDGGRDVFLQAGTKLVFYYDPAIHDAVDPDAIDSLVSVNDLTATRHTGGGGNDLLVVGPSGLSRVVWNASTRQFDVTSVSSATVWQGAVIVRAEDIDKNGVPDLVGVASDHRTVVVRMNGSTIESTFQLASTNTAVYDLQFVLWDTASAYRLCVLDTYGVEILTQTGVVIDSVARPAGVKDAITVFRKGYNPGSGVFERIAWARRKPSPSTAQEVVELYATALGLEVTSPSLVFASGSHCLRLAAGDLALFDDTVLAADGDEELLVMTELDYVPRLYANNSSSVTAASFSNSAGQHVDDETLSRRATSVTGGTSRPLPLFEDLNGEGMSDVFVPIADGTSSWTQVWRGGLPYEPVGGEVDRFTIETDNVTNTILQGGALPALQLFCDLPRNPAATGLQVIVWKRESCTLGVAKPYERDIHYYYPFEPNTPGPDVFTMTLELDFELESGGTFVANCQSVDFWIQVNLATLDGTNCIQVGESGFAVLSTNRCGQTGSVPYLTDSDPAWAQWVCVGNIEGCDAGYCCPNQGGCGSVQLDLGVYRRRRLAPVGGTLPSAGTPAQQDQL